MLLHRAHAFQASTSGAKGLSMINHSTKFNINTRLMIHLCISAVAAGAAAQSSRLPRLEQQCQRPVIGEHMKQFFSLFGSVCPGYGFAWPRAQIW